PSYAELLSDGEVVEPDHDHLMTFRRVADKRQAGLSDGVLAKFWRLVDRRHPGEFFIRIGDGPFFEDAAAFLCKSHRNLLTLVVRLRKDTQEAEALVAQRLVRLDIDGGDAGETLAVIGKTADFLRAFLGGYVPRQNAMRLP